MGAIDRHARVIADWHTAVRKGRPRAKRGVSLASPTQWDQGAMGPANRLRLRQENATDIDPETGKETPNPNGIKRQRRETWVSIYARKGMIERHHAAAAEKLRLASEGMRERDPLAAIGEVRNRGGDPHAARIDARRWFREMWSIIPAASKPVIERVVLDDLPIWGGNARQRDRHMRRLRDGLDAVSRAI